MPRREAARHWRRSHKDDGFFEEVVEQWSRAALANIDQDVANLQARRRAIQEDAASCFADEYCKRSGGMYELSFHEYMRSQAVWRD